MIGDSLARVCDLESDEFDGDLFDETSLQLPSDIAQKLFQITGQRGPAELCAEQLNQLCAVSRIVARHKRPSATILVLCDELGQHLVVMQNTNAPNFAFFPS